MGLYGNLAGSVYSGKFFTVNSLLTKQRHFIGSCSKGILQHGGFGHGTFHDTVVQEMRKDDEQSPYGHRKSLPSLKMIKFI